MIVIVTGPADAHADRVIELLTRRGESVARVDHRRFPGAAVGAVTFGATGLTGARWRDDAGAALDLRSIRSLWWRRPGRPVADGAITEPGAADFVAAESADFVDDLWDLDLVPALPGPRPLIRRAQYKARQLTLAARLGFELPPTLITNDADEALGFLAHHATSNVVTKQAGFTDLARRDDGTPDNWNAFVRYTERVSARDVAHVGALRHCPIILQAEVAKRHELRVTVVGSHVLAVAIHSQQNPRTALDWRRYDDRGTRHEIVDLDADLAERCVAMCHAQGLRYGAFDLIVTPDDRTVFVEVNPSGQYLWLEDLTGVPITAAIADELTAPSPLGPRPEPPLATPETPCPTSPMTLP